MGGFVGDKEMLENVGEFFFFNYVLVWGKFLERVAWHVWCDAIQESQA